MNWLSLKQRRDEARSPSGSYRGRVWNRRRLLGVSLWCVTTMTWSASLCTAEAVPPCESSRSGYAKMPACLSTVESSSTSSTTPQASGGFSASSFGVWPSCPPSSSGGHSDSERLAGESGRGTADAPRLLSRLLPRLPRNRCFENLAHRRLNTLKVRFQRRVSRWQRHSCQH